MKCLLLIFTVLAVATCSSVQSVKKLIEIFDYTDSAADALREATKTLIAETKIEFDDLALLTEREIELTTNSINANVDKVLKYSVDRTSKLVADLLADIQADQIYQIDYNECLITIPFIQSFNDNFQLTNQLSVNTGVRIGNETIRQNVETMTRIRARLDSYNNELSACDDNDLTCILGVSTGVVLMNDDFLTSSNSINENIVNLPGDILAKVISYANQTVILNEDYACANAEFVKICIKTFNDDQVNDDTTTTISELTTTTTLSPDTTTVDGTTTTQLSTLSTAGPTTISPPETTLAPNVICNREPFNPPINF